MLLQYEYATVSCFLAGSQRNRVTFVTRFFFFGYTLEQDEVLHLHAVVASCCRRCNINGVGCILGVLVASCKLLSYHVRTARWGWTRIPNAIITESRGDRVKNDWQKESQHELQTNETKEKTNIQE